MKRRSGQEVPVHAVRKAVFPRAQAHQKSLDLEFRPSGFFVEEFYGAVFEGQFFERDGKDAVLPDFGEIHDPFGVPPHYCRGVVYREAFYIYLFEYQVEEPDARFYGFRPEYLLALVVDGKISYADARKRQNAEFHRAYVDASVYPVFYLCLYERDSGRKVYRHKREKHEDRDERGKGYRRHGRFFEEFFNVEVQHDVLKPRDYFFKPALFYAYGAVRAHLLATVASYAPVEIYREFVFPRYFFRRARPDAHAAERAFSVVYMRPRGQGFPEVFIQKRRKRGREVRMNKGRELESRGLDCFEFFAEDIYLRYAGRPEARLNGFFDCRHVHR